MADYIVKDTELTSVANAIRTAGGTSSLLSFPNGFVSAVNNIRGGGGSSDFSTAEVTFQCSSNNGVWHATVAKIISDKIKISNESVSIDQSIIVLLPLYKGKYLLEGTMLSGIDYTVMPTLTGAIEFTQDGLMISGDGTVTCAAMR